MERRELDLSAYPTLAAALAMAQHRQQLEACGLQCPSDGAPLQRLLFKGCAVDLCGQCQSAWADPHTADKLDAQLSKKPLRDAARPKPKNGFDDVIDAIDGLIDSADLD